MPTQGQGGTRPCSPQLHLLPPWVRVALGWHYGYSCSCCPSVHSTWLLGEFLTGQTISTLSIAFGVGKCTGFSLGGGDYPYPWARLDCLYCIYLIVFIALYGHGLLL